MTEKIPGKLRQDGNRMVCISCYLFNCWHGRRNECNIEGCECTTGHDAEDQYATTG